MFLSFSSTMLPINEANCAGLSGGFGAGALLQAPSCRGG